MSNNPYNAPFDPMSDSIAITIPRFTLKKHADSSFQNYNEPYIVSMAIDESGVASPAIDFNMMPFPKVRRGGTVKMLGDGHLVYGPRNPGKFVALSVLVMESDSDLNSIGGQVEEIVSSKAVELGIDTIVSANPGSAAILAVLKELTQLVAGHLKSNKDDELFRIEGTFLRDHATPYHVNREYDNLGNDYIDMSMRILALASPNGQGPATRAISLSR
ncbi:hypothetical protein [Microbulbifer yueqingensis]|uniref:Uncharacterized protein n=1 Tax=Microbulbifer yueqingensis TaxID=658219 RepID=A0A1G8ZCZ8_9GAMM|nr:hypothetical protein [Microbulbifer yueqingensis]SDK12275.1 hypothetical protein SAMN05216212_1547 [Microbulbifer yueqingensis]